jgi:putative sporulation protein YtxC
MQVLAIGAAKHIDVIRDRLDYEFRSLEEEGIAVNVRQFNRGKITFLGCDLVRGQPAGELATLVRSFAANAVSDVILNEWETTLIRKLIRQSYASLNQDELDTVCEFVTRALDGQRPGDVDLLHRLDRKSRILARLLEFLERHDELVLDGFITFRLKDYIEELEDAVDRAVDDYLMDKEYQEFIRLLRYFIEMQESRAEEVHVLVDAGGIYRLIDGNDQPVGSDGIDELVVEMVDGTLEYEDLMISSLVALAPLRVIVHCHDPGRELGSLDTLRAIFGERLTVCRACNRSFRPAQSEPQPAP